MLVQSWGTAVQGAEGIGLGHAEQEGTQLGHAELGHTGWGTQGWGAAGLVWGMVGTCCWQWGLLLWCASQIGQCIT